MKKFIGILLALVMLAGCSSSHPGSGAGQGLHCPDSGWDVALVWSSEETHGSWVDFIQAGTVVGGEKLAYRGIPAAPVQSTARVGSDVWLFSNGGADRTPTNVLRWSQSDCSLRPYRVDEQALWSVAADEESFYTTNMLNFSGEVRRRDKDGRLLAEASFASIQITTLLRDGDNLYAVAVKHDEALPSAIVLVLDPITLKEKRRIDLKTHGAPMSATIRDGHLYVPIAVEDLRGGRYRELSGLFVVDLATGKVNDLPLNSASPYLVDQSDGFIIVGHSFMNPSIHEYGYYRTISIINSKNRDVATHNVDAGLLSMTVRRDRMWVATQTKIGGNVTVSQYTLPDMKKISSVEIEKPENGYYYVAGLIPRVA